ncbi:Fur family transcriptional regulator [Methylacidiphilum kamchatkense Kam1]|uniref:Fur family ferric uptake transcriptional regulator n=1 Tax=Methylacidiphilum kamchatkense Kam1 TaxID=1202785 RepID=A0A0C1UTB8_9BACT|nr:transcriptional repressor [Methylacidiphilum kamchatkense]KIE59058.1 Fur family transcriptional regulator [Methylacidiphilum kamchatkense Kam1]QDQ43036.1 Fur family ferric uptake transcriptional regulator [Methylacidiphilum kamchatkense Kam1]
MARKTKQKEAIVSVLRSAESPLSPAEIQTRASLLVPSLGIATVYRLLRILKENKKVVTVEIPGESPRYEISGRAHHHHFYCRNCHQIFEFGKCTDKIEELVPKGFLVQEHEIILYGRCPSCAK